MEVDGYFTTKGGRVLNSQAPVAELGLHPSQEVVLHGRLRGGGVFWGRKGCTRGWGVLSTIWRLDLPQLPSAWVLAHP